MKMIIIIGRGKKQYLLGCAIKGVKTINDYIVSNNDFTNIQIIRDISEKNASDSFKKLNNFKECVVIGKYSKGIVDTLTKMGNNVNDMRESDEKYVEIPSHYYSPTPHNYQLAESIRYLIDKKVSVYNLLTEATKFSDGLKNKYRDIIREAQESILERDEMVRAIVEEHSRTN